MRFRNNNNVLLPSKDAWAYLEFELEYYAFGTAASGGIKWTIMNGLNRSVDTVPEYDSDGKPTGKSATAGGSRFLVKIGDPPEPAPNVIVTY
jgi:hypothetical protein